MPGTITGSEFWNNILYYDVVFMVKGDEKSKLFPARSISDQDPGQISE